MQRKWDSPRIGDHSHCGHDDRRTPSVVPCSPLIMICKRPPEVGDRAVAEKLNDRPRKTLSYRKPSEAMLEDGF